MKMNFVITLVTVFISAIVLFAFAPMFIQATYETEDRVNDNSGWARFKYATGTTTDIEVSISDNVLSLGGVEPQTGPADDMIIWADNNLSVFIQNGTARYIGNNSGTVTTGILSDSFHIIKGASNTRITDNGDTLTFPASSWAYIPNAKGGYGSFIDGVNSHLNNDNATRPFVGGLLGVYNYNSINSAGYDLKLIVDKNGDTISGAEWIGNNTRVIE